MLKILYFRGSAHAVYELPMPDDEIDLGQREIEE